MKPLGAPETSWPAVQAYHPKTPNSSWFFLSYSWKPKAEIGYSEGVTDGVGTLTLRCVRKTTEVAELILSQRKNKDKVSKTEKLKIKRRSEGKLKKDLSECDDKHILCPM